jgi:primosomal protein N' (replication factor Y)
MTFAQRSVSETAAPGAPGGRIVRVVVDVSGLDKAFTYRLPAEMSGASIGTIVRVPLAGRKVRGWIVEDPVETPEGAPQLRDVIEIVSAGPSEEIVELARFSCWRYAGWLRAFLHTASPPRRISAIEARDEQVLEKNALAPGSGVVAHATREALSGAPCLLRLPPGASRLEVLNEVLIGARGNVLVLLPELRDVERLAERLRRARCPVAIWPEDWAVAARGGAVVLGTRSALFARVPRLSDIVVFDAHDSDYRQQRVPTWETGVLALERARRIGASCLLVSACPSLEHRALMPEIALGEHDERALWPHLEVIDRRGDDPRLGLYSADLAEIVRGARDKAPELPVLCVLNRAGRAKLLACASCGALLCCEHCGHALVEDGAAETDLALICPSCHERRPAICATCGSTRTRRLRVGVKRAREELEALIGESVSEVADQTPGTRLSGIVVGTEAVLHKATSASLVIFLDFDQELAAARLRAGEQALALLALAARLCGGRRRSDEHGFARRIVVQTRQPGHEVIAAVRDGDPGRYLAAEDERRRQIGLPPYVALAAISGERAAELLEHVGPRPNEHIDLLAQGDGSLLVRAPRTEDLCDALEVITTAFSDGLRIEVDPLAI